MLARRPRSPADVAAAPSAACGTAANAPGERTIDFTGDGLASTYILRLPPAATTGNPLPLVLDLHGYSEPAAIHAAQSALASYGDTAGFVTALPQIVRPVPLWDASVGSSDVAYLGALLDELEATVCIDTNRVYVAGLSNGAFMTSIAACDLSDRIAAAAPVAGIQAPVDCDPARPVPVIAFHGTADTFVPYTGGLGSSVASLPSPDGSGTIGEASARRPLPPRRAPRCRNEPRRGPFATAVLPPRARSRSPPTSPCCASTARQVTRWSCIRVEGGGHSWPGSAFSAQIESIVGPTTMSIDSTALIWQFLVDHPLRG